jgi:anaerobic selenocysteine-containing dehydrogenase
MEPVTTYEIKTTVCPHDCPDTCALEAHVQDGKLVKVTGDARHATTRGFICAKVRYYPERVYSPDRILTPLRRVGKKGEGKFERITWEEALQHIAKRFKEILAVYGGEAILPYSYAGTEGVLNNASMDRRFFHKLGACLLARTICSAAGKAGYAYTTGATYGSDPENIPYARLIISWGTNSSSQNIHILPLIKEARAKGAIYIHINPHRSDVAEKADYFLQIRPGTDAALALGMMHIIVKEGLYDADYVNRFTYGFDKLKERLEEYPPERVSEITGISVEEIQNVARLYARIKPSFLRVGWGFQRHSNGGMTMRTISCLPGLVGAWGQLGGGFLYSNGGLFPLNMQALERPDLMTGTPRTLNMVELAKILTELDNPPIKALYVYNCNPAAVAPNQNKVIQGLLREDLFTVVHEQVFTDTVDYADIVLPATTSFEHLDLYRSYWHLYLQLGEPVIPPVGESKSNVEVFRLLAQAMGFKDPCFRDTEEDLIRQALDSPHPFLKGITLERLRQEKQVRLNTPTYPFIAFADGKFPTPSGKIEFYSERMKQAGFDPLPAYIPETESAEGSPELYRKYPISLINAGAKYFVNSSFGNLKSMLAKEKRPVIELHYEDAKARGISEGDRVRVYNDRGECFLYARVGETVPKGSAISFKSWWNKKTGFNGNLNRITSHELEPLGGGAVFYTNLVEVEKVSN